VLLVQLTSLDGYAGPLLSTQWRITHSRAGRYVRTPTKVSTTGDPKRADPIACLARSGDDRGVAEAVARGLSEMGGTDRLRGPRPPPLREAGRLLAMSV
jgi:hypothetical protein